METHFASYYNGAYALTAKYGTFKMIGRMFFPTIEKNQSHSV